MQRRHMKEELASLSLQHSKRLEELIEQHSAELKKLELLKDEEIKVSLRFYRKKLLHVNSSVSSRPNFTDTFS